MQRHYGMDWVRIGAFALLILYHVGMVFVPWPYQVKTATPADWVTVPMLFTNAWRLMLLFVVSGYASRALYARSAGLRAFLRNRNLRLLLPLIFGIAVIVPPQSWVELVTLHGYGESYGDFWTRDYFRFGTLDGLILPTWNHLWFVVYLWIYTQALALLLIVPRPPRMQARFDRLVAGARALWLPILYLLVFQVLLFHRGVETHDLLNDGVAHLAYFPAFLFGFGLAGSPSTLAGFARGWPLAAILALAGYAVVGSVEAIWPGKLVPPYPVGLAFAIAREVQTWASIAALIGIAERYLNRDHRWRATLTEAVFPFYIIHQTVIVVTEYAIRPLALPGMAEFAILVAATVAGCWLFYLAGREIAPLRPLIGLKLASPRRSATPAAQPLGVP